MPTRPFLKLLALCALLPFLLFATYAKSLLLDESDESTHICLYPGDTLTIKLVSNPTTGFTWTNPESPTNLALLSSKSTRDPADPVGAPGFQVFSFNATAPGESVLVLKYLRPFEKNTPPAKMFHLFITIEARPALNQALAPKA
ncbi:MAG: protease inhibitor I42 family protein [Candidatus Acidiferrum sp.]